MSIFTFQNHLIRWFICYALYSLAVHYLFVSNLYFLYLRDFTTSQLAALRNQSDRNIRGVRSTVLGQIEKKVLMILVDRQGEDFPFTPEELDFLSRHEEEIPATMEKLDKEKLALLKEIGVVVRRITREQEKRAKEEAKKQKKNNRTNHKKEV